jgi:predicted CXXCH cytochrome family protein
MKGRFRQTWSYLPGLGVLAIVTGVLLWGSPGPISQAEEPQSTPTSQPAQAEPTPATQPTEKQLREKPLAAGRNKAAQAAEAAAATQPAGGRKPPMDLSNIPCNVCHSCDNPSKEDRCLRFACPRSADSGVAEAIAAAAHEQLPPDIFQLDAFEWTEKRFMPVKFHHKLHANMAGVAGGCEVCHHHTAKGQLHPSCKTCHKAQFEKTSRDEMRMPSLKGAYHRQCMGCHRNWSHNTKCSICHAPKDEQTEPIPVEQVLPPGDVAGRHPPIENPEQILVKTEYKPGPNVMFRHRQHVERYGYECERCHRGQSCGRCHEPAQKPKEQLGVVKEKTHEACFSCHEDDTCDRCHSPEETPSPKAFDHSLTGFSLGKYHERLTCRACHKRLFFTRVLQGECTFCHKDWEPETFQHAVTGQDLDETHAEIACQECHKDGRFISPPSCSECHEEDVAFPVKRPGPVTSTAPASKEPPP